jgi:hypothetical protein
MSDTCHVSGDSSVAWPNAHGAVQLNWVGQDFTCVL